MKVVGKAETRKLSRVSRGGSRFEVGNIQDMARIEKTQTVAGSKSLRCDEKSADCCLQEKLQASAERGETQFISNLNELILRSLVMQGGVSGTTSGHTRIEPCASDLTRQLQWRRQVLAAKEH